MADPLTVAELLAELGGVARRSALLHVVTRKDLDAALGGALVVRDARGLYALPSADEGRRIAAQLGGVLSLTSAALDHGWGVKTVPDRPHVIVGRGRKPGKRASLAHVHWAELGEADVVDGVLTEKATLLDCLRNLAFDEALAVADSALRESGCVRLLEQIADEARGPGSPQIRRVAAEASPLAANAFESALRAITLDVPGLRVEPQGTVQHGEFSARADLVDRRLWIVVEADSFTWHGSRSALASDCRRYNQMVIGGWLVLRFSYEDVMFHPDEVRDVLVALVARAELLVEVGQRAWRSA